MDSMTGKKEDPDINSFAKSYNQHRNDLIVFCDHDCVGKNVVAALKRIAVGLSEWDYSILAAAACCNSILCNILPIIELKGSAGSGKTQLLLAISEISGNTPISGQSTGASLKNYINQVRWVDPDAKLVEKSCVVLIDNLNEDTFKKEEYLASFLNGYNRKTDRTFISNGKGENIEFKTFTLKVYTTIWDTQSSELKRRTVFIQTKKSKSLGGVVDIDDVDWRSLSIGVKDFWKLPANWTEFVVTKRLIAKEGKAFGGFKEQWTLLNDLLATGVVTGVFPDAKAAVTTTVEYLERINAVRYSLLEAVVLKALEDDIGFERAKWPALSETVRIHVGPRVVKNAIDIAVTEGLIDRPKLASTQEALRKLGFAPGKKDQMWGYRFKGGQGDEGR